MSRDRPDPTTTRRRLLAAPLVGAGWAASGLAGLGGRDAPSDGSLPASLDERVPDLLDAYDVPGAAIAVIEDGRVVWRGAYGSADPATGRPTTDTIPFRVQSITKSVTAWAVLTLVEAGEIALDDPVGQHVTSWELPDAPYPWAAVTVRRLLAHSAGLPDGWYEDVPLDEEPPPLRDALSGAAAGPIARPTTDPDTFRYSNPGYALVELLVEEVTGRDFAAYVAEAVLEPLGMDGATFAVTDELRSTLATEHLVDGTPVPASHGPARAPGALYATVDDVARFVAAGSAANGDPLGRGVLAPERVATLYAPVVETTGFYGLATEASGLGHFVETLADGERAVMNGGQGPGSWHWFHTVPETGDGIVVLTNSERSLQLIADVVGTWADATGHSGIYLTRAQRWVRLPVWVLVGVATGLALRLGYGVGAGTRTFAPLSDRDRIARGALGGLAAVTVGLWWALGHETVAHVLPVIADWIGLAIWAVVILALVTVLVPRTDGSETP